MLNKTALKHSVIEQLRTMFASLHIDLHFSRYAYVQQFTIDHVYTFSVEADNDHLSFIDNNDRFVINTANPEFFDLIYRHLKMKYFESFKNICKNRDEIDKLRKLLDIQ